MFETVECGGPRRRLLIVNADDFGLHEDINRGIYLAHTRGIVTSASIVACGDAFPDAATILQQCPALDIGIHLTLVGERPLCAAEEVRTLVRSDGSFFHSYREFAGRTLTGSISGADIQRELRAQIDRVISTGRHPSHLDSHQHVHLLPPVWRITRQLAIEYGIRWVRLPHFTSLLEARRSPLDPVFRFGLNMLSARTFMRRSIRTAGLHLSGQLGTRDLLRLFRRLRPGITEIATHPGVSTAALSARYGWGYDWSTELAALTSPETMSALASDEIELTRFSDCDTGVAVKPVY